MFLKSHWPLGRVQLGPSTTFPFFFPRRLNNRSQLVSPFYPSSFHLFEFFKVNFKIPNLEFNDTREHCYQVINEDIFVELRSFVVVDDSTRFAFIICPWNSKKRELKRIGISSQLFNTTYPLPKATWSVLIQSTYRKNGTSERDRWKLRYQNGFNIHLETKSSVPSSPVCLHTHLTFVPTQPVCVCVLSPKTIKLKMDIQRRKKKLRGERICFSFKTIITWRNQIPRKEMMIIIIKSRK